MTKTGTITKGITALLLCGALATGALTIGAPLINQLAYKWSLNQKYWGTTEGQKDAVREATYSTLCPTWRDAGWWEKNVQRRNLSWCADYLDRL